MKFDEESVTEIMDQFMSRTIPKHDLEPNG